MADLVRDHIGLRKLARPAADVAAAETRRDLIEERGVEVDLLIGRAVERSHGALRGSTATCVRRAAIENQHGCAVELAILGEDLLPLQFGAAEHLAHEAAHVVLRRAGPAPRGRRRHRRRAGPGQALGAADEQAWVDAERPADEAKRHDRADAQSAAADRKAETAAATETALFASILDVAAFRQIVQAHGSASLPAAGHTAAAAVAFRLPPRRSTRLRQYSC